MLICPPGFDVVPLAADRESPAAAAAAIAASLTTDGGMPVLNGWKRASDEAAVTVEEAVV